MTFKRHTPHGNALFKSLGVPGSERVSLGTRKNNSPHSSLITHHSSLLRGGFTLIEMLTVITIIAIIVGLAVPVFKNYGKANVTVSASRQLLDDIGHARQLALAQRTTVYMVFLPTNFWTLPNGTSSIFDSGSGLTPNQWVAGSNLLDKQLTGYILMAHGDLGDQPGNHQWHYLTPWQELPNGTYIPLWKFYNGVNPGVSFNFSDPVNNNNFSINAFAYTNTFPFPTQDSVYAPSYTPPMLPFIAFNYLGQLSDYSGNLLSASTAMNKDLDFVGAGIDIPLAQGAVLPDIDQSTKAVTNGPPEVVEQPLGNSTNLTYNVVHIDPLTGRATLEYHKMQ
jgi:prepilin-type N-terminal cleavage/methylation domain-containing protein